MKTDDLINNALRSEHKNEDCLMFKLEENEDGSISYDTRVCCTKHLVQFISECMLNDEELAAILKAAVVVYELNK